jgi:hypothetical protein
MGIDLNGDFFANLQRLQLSLPAGDPPATTAATGKAPSKGKIKGEFLKGPVPLAWLSSAARLAGKAPLAVGLAIWFEAGRRRSNEFILTTAILARFNVSRKAKYRALEILEEARLIRVYRKPRRNPVVTILDGETPSLAPASRGVTDADGTASES